MSDGTPRVLHVLATLDAASGGPAKAAVDMAVAARRAGADVAILTTDFGSHPVDTAAARAAGVRVESFPVAAPRFWKRSPALADALAAEIPRVDVVHLHSLYLYHDWIVGALCRHHGVPYLLRPHGSLDPFIYRRHRWRKAAMDALFQNRVLRGAAALHFTAADEARLARPVAHNPRAVVLPLGVHLAEFADLPAAERFIAAHPETRGRRIVLFLGRLNFKKGLDLLVAAFAEVVAAVPNLHLVLAGPDDGMQAKVEGWVAQRGIASSVTFTGMLRGADRLAAYAAAEVFVLPSYSENFGISVVEAMACGVPTIVSDRVNIWREIDADDAGVVVPCDAEALACALRALADAPERRADLIERARASVAARFDWDRIGPRLTALYRVVAARQPLDAWAA